MPLFSEENIQTIFGHEAAEDESPERLSEYYFKNQTFEKIKAALPLRILVGHKGIGKSALFAVARWEDEKAQILSLLLRPDDVLEIAEDINEFNKQIKSWKTGLLRVIEKKIAESLGVTSKQKTTLATGTGKALLLLKDTFKPLLASKVDLDPIKAAFREQFLKANHLNVYIDDLDRGWQGRKADIIRISALLNAVRDLSNFGGGIRFRIALRSDVYYAVRTSDESTDKLEGSVIWYSWTNHEILALLVKRIETFSGKLTDEAQLLKLTQDRLAESLVTVMTPRFMGVGKWNNAPIHRILMSLIRKRPRDLVKLCTAAARQAHQQGRDLILTHDLQAIFGDYSQARIQDTVNEHRSELPDVERLLMNMKPNRVVKSAAENYQFTTDQLIKKVKRVMEQGEFTLANHKAAAPRELAAFMYKINFLTARKLLPDGFVDRKYFEENRYLSSTLTDFGYDWEIHPAYRWALQPDKLESLYDDIALSAD